MPIRNVNDAREVEDAFARILDPAQPNRANEVRKLFVEVLDFAPDSGSVSLEGASANVQLPPSAERIAQLDGFNVLYIDLNTVDTDRVRVAEVTAAAQRVEVKLGEDMLIIATNNSANQLHIIHPDFSGSRLVLRRMVALRDVPRRTVVQQIANIYEEYRRRRSNLRAVLSNAFSVEPLTDKFFTEYQRVFGEAEKAITGVDEDDKRLFTQTLFNRLMFVHFLSRKGWLSINGDTDYLRALWNDYQAKDAKETSQPKPNFYRDRLWHLFFDGLNKPPQERARNGIDFIYGNVPFLNGGLFSDEGKYDKPGASVTVPDSVIQSALDDLFEKYNFTVMESTPFDIEVAVDPEMLGKVFEELVNERHDSGAYYTPRPVVSFMCREAIKGYLEGKDTGADANAIAAFVDTRNTDGITIGAARNIDRALDDITVVDPACGSGAFLLGMMSELIELYTTLYNAGVDARSLYNLKLHIIQRSLYGVDIDKFAANIAMLRLWLSLAIDYEDDAPEKLPPLPNLDFKIITGDSLLGPDPNPDKYPDLFRNRAIEIADELAGLKGEYMKAYTGPDKQRLRNDVQSLETELTEALSDSADPDNAVDWRVQFTEVFNRGGFDVAIANPPYVRQENIGESKAELTRLYADAAVARSDLYCYFYARALQLLANGGSHVFVCSNSWLDVGYGAKLQEYLLANAHVRVVYESAVERQFSTADINTIISLIRKGRPDAQAVTRFVSFRDEFDKAVGDATLRKEFNRTRDALVTAGTDDKKYVGDKWGGKYLRAPDIYHYILNEKADKLVRFGDIADVRFGLKTGANEFFYLNEDKISEWGIEPEFLRPVMTTPRESRSLLVDASTLPNKLFMCHKNKSELEGTAALAYIEWGETQGFHMRSSVRSRRPWYDLGNRDSVAMAINRRVNDVSRTFTFQRDCFVGDTLYEVHQDMGDARAMSVVLNCTLFQLFYNSEGRTNFGQGVLEMEVYEVQQISVVENR